MKGITKDDLFGVLQSLVCPNCGATGDNNISADGICYHCSADVADLYEDLLERHNAQAIYLVEFEAPKCAVVVIDDEDGNKVTLYRGGQPGLPRITPVLLAARGFVIATGEINDNLISARIELSVDDEIIQYEFPVFADVYVLASED